MDKRGPFGRDPIFDYVADALKRKGTPRIPVPALLLVGPPGSGGTAVLNRLWADHEDCPGARIAKVCDETVASALGRAMLAFKAKRGLGVRPVKHFPRMFLAAKALRYPGDPGDLQAFIAYLEEPVDNDEVAAILRLLLPGIPGLRDPGALADIFKWARAGHNRRECRRLAEDLGGYPTMFDAAGRSQQAQQAKTGQTPLPCDRLLVDAFLSDLREDSNRGRAMQRHTNLLMLLDDCDDESGDRLVDLVDSCRRAAYHAGDPDPLVIVAVRHHRRPTEQGALIAADDAKTLRLAPRDARDPLPERPDLWRPVALTPLDSENALAMIRTMETGSDRQDAEFVLALAGGHPAAVRTLTDLLFALQEAALGPPGLLAGPWPPEDKAQTTVLNHLLERFLPTGEDQLKRLAVIASAATGLDATACTAVYRYLDWNGNVADDESWLRTRLWIEDEDDGKGGSAARLHPLVARLARQYLAGDAELWNRVHNGFERHYDRIGDADSQTARRWHLLATVTGPGDAALAGVADFLLPEIKVRPIEEFRLLVDRIATAPSRLAPSADAVLELNRIAGTADSQDRRRTVTRRLVARWLHGTVYLDPRGHLAKVVDTENGYLHNFGRGSE